MLFLWRNCSISILVTRRNCCFIRILKAVVSFCSVQTRSGECVKLLIYLCLEWHLTSHLSRNVWPLILDFGYKYCSAQHRFCFCSLHPSVRGFQFCRAPYCRCSVPPPSLINKRSSFIVPNFFLTTHCMSWVGVCVVVLRLWYVKKPKNVFLLFITNWNWIIKKWFKVL